LLPAPNPERAEVAVAIKYHQWFRWRLGDPYAPCHAGILDTPPAEMQIAAFPPGSVLNSGARHLCRFIGQNISWREAGWTALRRKLGHHPSLVFLTLKPPTINNAYHVL
jgi:hypothetical protein